jgi:hypothetical protein
MMVIALSFYHKLKLLKNVSFWLGWIKHGKSIRDSSGLKNSIFGWTNIIGKLTRQENISG